MTTQTGTTAIANSIIAGNLSGSEDIGTDVDFDGTNNYTSNDGNLIGTGSAITIFNQNQDNTDVTNPKLEPLADNGGPTQTHNLESDSPALDAGVNSALPEDTLDLNSDSNTSEALPIDQRGSARIANETVDIGAVEVPGVIRGTNRRDSLSGSLLDDSFNLGFVYAQNVRRLAFIDTEEDIPLTQFAILPNQPELEASNIQVF